MNIGGSKERKSGDKSFHGLLVALAMAGTIAGSAILFAYAAYDGAAVGTETQAAPSEEEPEPKVIEKVVEKPVYIEKVKYINRTIEVEKPVYINRTIEVEKPVYVNRTVEVPVYIEKEVEKPVYIDRPVYVNESEEEQAPTDEQKESEKELSDDELELIPKSVRELLYDIGDFDDDKEEDEYEDDDHNDKKGKDKGKD